MDGSLRVVRRAAAALAILALPAPCAQAGEPAFATPAPAPEVLAPAAATEAVEPAAGPEPAKQEVADDKEECEGLCVDLGHGLGFSLDGYYRARWVDVRDLHMYLKNQTSTDKSKKMRGSLDFFVQRLRLEPVISYKDVVSLEIWIHALDNLVWGDNAGLSDVGVFAGEPSNTNRDGGDIPSLTIPAAWIEVNVLVGVLRAGRMPSDWGLGLLTDGGGGFDDDFGWNDVMSVTDRVLFATMPVAIGQKIAKHEGTPFPLYLAVAYDKLVTEDIGIAGNRDLYTSDWLSEYKDDVDSFTAALAYDGEDLGWIGAKDSLAAGFYYVQRWQHVTRSRAHILDGFFKIRLGPAFAEAEAYWILGHSQAIALRPSAVPGDPDSWLREKADVEISSWIARVGYEVWKLLFKLEAGFASGDDNVGDGTFSVRPANQNVKVGLVLYDLMIAEVTRLWWQDNPGMWSKGGIFNSYFFMQTIRFEPVSGLEVILAFLQAWRHKADGTIYPRPSVLPEKSRFLGFETDLAVKYHFHGGHAHIGVEAGLLRVGNAWKDPVLNMPDHTWTVQAWTAFTP